MKLIEKNKEWKYHIYQLETITEDNLNEWMFQCEKAIAKIQMFLRAEQQGQDTTFYYSRYNIWTVTPGNKMFFELYKELLECIKDFCKTNEVTHDKGLYLQSWFNNHRSDNNLERHNHFSPIHGYIAVNPQHSKTVFYEQMGQDDVAFTINNKLGQLYIGPGNLEHEVITTKEYDGPRYSIGFDIDDNEETHHLSMIPLVIE